MPFLDASETTAHSAAENLAALISSATVTLESEPIFLLPSEEKSLLQDLTKA